MVELARAVGSTEHELTARAFRARLALLLGDLSAVDRWLPTANPATEYALPITIEVPALTRARALLAQSTDASLAEVDRGLAELLDLYAARHDTLRVIEILALQAAACRAQGEMEQALTVIRRAVELAAPGGLIRTFVDLGPAVAALLGELTRHSEHREYLGQVLSAFGGRPHVPPLVLPDHEGRHDVRRAAERA